MIRLGIIGSGPVAAKHLEVLGAHPGARAAAISGRDSSRRDLLGDRFGIPDRFESHGPLLASGAVDAVLALVAPDAMFPVGRDCFESGIPTFLEKPPGLSPSEASLLARIARDRETPNMVGLNRRFYSSVRAAKAAIDAAGPLLGLRIEAPEDLARARAAGRKDSILSSWIFANGIHMIDLVRFLGGPIRSRHAIRRTGPERDSVSLAATIEFENDAIGQYSAHWGSPGAWSLTLHGRDVTAVLSPLEEGYLLSRDGRPVPFEIDPVDRSYKPGFHAQMGAFLDMVRCGRPAANWPAASIEDAAASMELAGWLLGGVP